MASLSSEKTRKRRYTSDKQVKPNKQYKSLDVYIMNSQLTIQKVDKMDNTKKRKAEIGLESVKFPDDLEDSFYHGALHAHIALNKEDQQVPEQDWYQPIEQGRFNEDLLSKKMILQRNTVEIVKKNIIPETPFLNGMFTKQCAAETPIVPKMLSKDVVAETHLITGLCCKKFVVEKPLPELSSNGRVAAETPVILEMDSKTFKTPLLPNSKLKTNEIFFENPLLRNGTHSYSHSRDQLVPETPAIQSQSNNQRFNIRFFVPETPSLLQTTSTKSVK